MQNELQTLKKIESLKRKSSRLLKQNRFYEFIEINKEFNKLSDLIDYGIKLNTNITDFIPEAKNIDKLQKYTQGFYSDYSY